MKFPALPAIAPSFTLVGVVAATAMLLGILGGWKFGSGHWKGRYTAEVSQGWERQAKAERAAQQALQIQLEMANATISRNTGVINDYEQKKAATGTELARNRAALERLRAEAARAAARRSAMPETDRGRAAFETRQAEELTECQGLLIEGVAEGTDNADQLDGLVSEIKPQL